MNTMEAMKTIDLAHRSFLNTTTTTTTTQAATIPTPVHSVLLRAAMSTRNTSPSIITIRRNPTRNLNRRRLPLNMRRNITTINHSGGDGCIQMIKSIAITLTMINTNLNININIPVTIASADPTR